MVHFVRKDGELESVSGRDDFGQCDWRGVSAVDLAGSVQLS